METISTMYITLMPVILAGVLNMVWCKTKACQFLNKPVDNYIILKDGKRLFGENKTWKGFMGMIVLGIICSVIWGILANDNYLYTHNYIYYNHQNTLLFNIMIGFLLGFAYALFELPNSYIKRRININPGKAKNGFLGKIFVLIDQIDSLFGCVLIICFVYPMSGLFYICYVLLGGMTHIIINMLLYILKLRKNMF